MVLFFLISFLSVTVYAFRIGKYVALLRHEYKFDRIFAMALGKYW